jgi:RimJ/RimL family protein N-acetyltransferase
MPIVLAGPRDDALVHMIRSGVAPDNAPSLRVNEKLGFVRTGQIVDGEIIFELRVPRVDPAVTR